MTSSFKTRFKVIKRDLKDSAGFDFGAALREARLRAEAGNPVPQTPITVEMMKDPVYGHLWRQMFEARERVRLLRDPGE
jgi:hypothetical protein